MAWQKTRIEIPKGFTKSVREAIGQDILEFIQDKAIKENRGFNSASGRNRKFPKYTKEYAKEKGSSRSDVDLILSGNMFTDMKLLSQTPDSLLIGFKNNTKSNSKAEGNQTGSYGRSANNSKARPFLGLTEGEKEEILDKHRS